MPIMDFFSHVYVINLDKRTDRWAAVQNELRKLGVAHRTTRISGVDLGSHDGCTASHKKFLDIAIANGRGVSLVLEDDAVIRDDWNEILQNGLKCHVNSNIPPYHQCKNTLPGDWDILYLGYNLDPHSQGTRSPNFVAHNLVQLHGCLTTHMYAVNCDRLDRIKKYRNLMDSYNIKEIDMLYLTIQLEHQFNVYGTYPMIATQRSGFSDISGFDVVYHLQENVDKVLKAHNKFVTRPQ